MSVTHDEIVAAIRSLGVRAGDLLIAHSSYKSFGADGVQGGPITVARAIVDAVSPGGSAFVPTFNYGNDIYDSLAAPSYDGVITEFFRKLPGAIRSLHPTHPLSGIGPSAREILDGHDRVHAFGQGSPCRRLWERDAWVLLIGVDHRANSMAHVAEELLQMPYLDRKRIAGVRRDDGSVHETIVRRPGCSDAWQAVLDPPLRAIGAIHGATIGQSRLMLMRSRDVVQATMDLLRANPAALLCDSDACDACNQARRLLA